MKPFFLTLVAVALVALLLSCNKDTGSTAVVPPVVTPPTTTTTTTPAATTALVFYVSGATGSDNNTGVEARPFATIQKAAQVATAGYTVLIKAGTYVITAPIMPANSGTEAAPIIFKAETGAEVIIDGKTQVPADKVGGLFYMLNKNWIVVDGLTFRNSRRDGVQIRNSTGVNGKVHHNTVYDLYRTGIYIDAYEKDLTNVEVYANTVYNAANGISIASEEGGILTGVQIHDNLIYDCKRVGIRLSGYLDNGPLRDLDVYQNTVTRCGFGTTGTWENVGLLIEADNLTNRNFSIRNNIFAGNAYQIRTKSQAYAILANNTVFGPTYAPGTGSITTDPMFVNALTNDFRLKPGAPGIDKATGTLLSTSDRRDQPRPLDGDGDGKAVGDLGALEYKL